MIIDSHCHLKHGDAAGTEFTAEEIVSAMDGAGIERSVVFAMSTTTARSIEMAEDAVRAFPDRLIPYVYALPGFDEPVLPLIKSAVRERGFKGIKIHEGQCRLVAEVIDPVFVLAGELGVPCLVDFCGRSGPAERLASTFADTVLIIAHIGTYLGQDREQLRRFISIAEDNENVYIDSSGVALTDMIVEAVQAVGSSRVLFGTDGPQTEPDTAAFAQKEVEKITGLELADEDQANILGGTVRDLLQVGV